jgi:CheY-like chemotaxis protein
VIETTENPQVGAPPQGLTRSALLVEDEPLVAMLTEDNLRDLGFEPIWVASATEALQVLNGGAPIALAVIDVGLPDMRGDELARQIRRDRPGLGVILATGHDAVTLGGRFADDARTVVLAKPYMAADLERSAQAVAGG